MKAHELKYVHATVENEGFDYAFRHYTDFKDTVRDTEFHRLREAYEKAANELIEYCGLQELA